MWSWLTYRFWELFFAKELEYFHDRKLGPDDKSRVQLTFKEYCVGPDLVGTAALSSLPCLPRNLPERVCALAVPLWEP